jgi:hypothetical protein
MARGSGLAYPPGRDPRWPGDASAGDSRRLLPGLLLEWEHPSRRIRNGISPADWVGQSSPRDRPGRRRCGLQSGGPCQGIPKPHRQFDFSAAAKQHELWGGQFDRTSNILNVQPVIPVPLSENLTLVNRTIMSDCLSAGTRPRSGLSLWFGGHQLHRLLCPSTTGNFTWGVGPSILLPTATDTVLGTGKWSVGPAAVGLVTQGPIVAGGLVSQLWSFAGDSDRVNVSLFTFQPFFNYNFDGGWYLTYLPHHYGQLGGQRRTVDGAPGRGRWARL